MSRSLDLVRFQPMRHYTDTKIRLYALVCVLGLLVLKLSAPARLGCRLTLS